MFKIIKLNNKYLIVCNSERENRVIENSYRVIAKFNTIHEYEGFLSEMNLLYKEVLDSKKNTTM